jgi:hypothetical protein
MWDWGDGNFSDWLGPFASGVTSNAQHSWTIKGTYSIRVKAKDTNGAESNWSEPLAVTMPRNYANQVFFFERLEQRFPIVYLFLCEVFNRFGI